MSDCDALATASVRKAAEVLALSVSQVRRRIKDGSLVAVKDNDRTHPNGAPLRLVVLPDQADAPGRSAGVGRIAAAQDAVAPRRGRTWRRRLRAVQAVQARLAEAGHGQKSDAWTDVAEANGVAVSTLRSWVRRYRKAGPLAVKPPPPSRRGATVFTVEVQACIVRYYLQEGRPTPTQVHRNVVVPWYAEADQKCPHETTTARFIDNHVLPIAKVALREGPHAFAARVVPKVSRKLPGPGEVWSADHRIQDVMLVDADGKTRRPWVTQIIDVGSAAIVGYCVCETPSSDSIAAAVFDAVLNWGAPRKFQRDNGKDFTSKRLGGKAARRDDALSEDAALWGELGTELTTAIPYSPWSKPIESLFRAFRDFAGENLLPGWTGIDAQDKPEALAVQVKTGRLMREHQFADWYDGKVRAWNTEHVCGERRGTPNELYRQARDAGRVREAPGPDSLAWLLQHKATAKVSARGLQFLGRLWWGPEIAIYVGSRVTVRGLAGICYAYAYPSGETGPCIALQPKERASWDHADGPGNRVARQGAKLQRAFIRAVKSWMKDVPIEAMDPDGVWRQAAANAEAHREAERAGQALPAPRQAQLEARQKALAEPKPEARRTIYAPDAEEEAYFASLEEDAEPAPKAAAPPEAALGQALRDALAIDSVQLESAGLLDLEDRAAARHSQKFREQAVDWRARLTHSLAGLQTVRSASAESVRACWRARLLPAHLLAEAQSLGWLTGQEVAVA